MTTRPTGETDAVASRVRVYRRETYLAVEFAFRNVRERAVTVGYQQSVPDDLADSHLSFSPSYAGEAWTFENASLLFSVEIPGGEQLVTVYGIKHVELAELVDLIGDAAVVVRQDGTTVERVTGIEPEIDGVRDTAEEGTSDGVPAGTESERKTVAGGAAGSNGRPPALPANRAEYILEDIRGEIESTEEFEWVGPTNGADTGGILGWVRSRLPL